MKRCFLLILLFISMTSGAWAESGPETIVWEKFKSEVGRVRNSIFSHNGKMIGFFGDQIAGVIRVSDSTLLWKDSVQFYNVQSMDFSEDDSLFVYTRYRGKTIKIRNSASGAIYKYIPLDSSITEIRFLDSSRIIARSYDKVYIVDYRDSTIKYSETTRPDADISSTGQYFAYLPQTYPNTTHYWTLRRIFRDSISKQSLSFTGAIIPDTVKGLVSTFSRDDKLMVLIPNENNDQVGTYPDGMPMYIFNLETFSCSLVMVPEITRTLSFALIDVDKKHIIIQAQLNPHNPAYSNLIVSLEDGTITNSYVISGHDGYGFLRDASPDSLYYVTEGYKGMMMLKAVRTTSDVPIFKSNGDVRIFPNPSISGRQTISIEGISEAKSIIISDIFGREAFRSEYIQSSGNSGISFQTPSLQKGVYFISIIDGEGRLVTKKLMVGE